MKFELTDKGRATYIDTYLNELIKLGYLKTVEPETEKSKPLPLAHVGNFSTGLNTQHDPFRENNYIGNHLPITTNIKSISRDVLGVCEDQKLWDKPLKEAVKTYGHDEILSGYYNWALAWSGSYLGNKPVSMFLKDVESNLNSATGKKVTSPILDRTCKRIAYVSDNKVVFTGNYRVRLATILNQYGEELTVKAFEDFYKDVDDRGQQWAAKDFLQKAEIMISTIQIKQQDEDRAKAALQNALQAAQASVDEDEEEDNEL